MEEEQPGSVSDAADAHAEPRAGVVQAALIDTEGISSFPHCEP